MHGIFKQFSVLVKQAEIDAPSIYAETFDIIWARF